MTDAPFIGKKILLIEDEEISQRAIKIQLEFLGCEVDLASSGKEALILLKNPYQLIFLDIGLADSDGFSIAKSLKQNNNVNQKTPIIVQTANILDIYQKKCKELKINALYKKPFTSMELKEILEKFIGR